MPRKRLSMRKIKEIMRLKFASNLTNRQIGKSINISPSTVDRYIKMAVAAGFSWPLAENITDDIIEISLFKKSNDAKPLTGMLPDYAYIHQELKRKGVTKQLLWEEYRQQYPNNYYSYSHFCNHYRSWCCEKKLTMRQVHVAGEKVFVDYAGHTIEITDPETDEITKAQIFIAVLGASNYTYVEATKSQKLPDWISSHVNTFNYFGGVPEIVVPDNLKSGVSKACRYEPDINPTYQQMAEHYNLAVIPARPYKPKDKSKAEVGVQIVERWILAALRNKKYFSLAELNSDIKKLLEDLNNKPFKKLPGSRRSSFISLDKPALKPLPQIPYKYTEIKTARVHLDYHVEYNRHYYSVPYKFVKKKVELRITNNTVSIFYKSERIASHVYSSKKGFHTTISEHMPEKHRKHKEWTPERFANWGNNIGVSTLNVVQQILQQRSHPEQNYRTCLGLLSLSKKYSDSRLEAACKKAIVLGTYSRRSIASILLRGLDQIETEELQEARPNIEHENIRGSDYYS